VVPCGNQEKIDSLPVFLFCEQLGFFRQNLPVFSLPGPPPVRPWRLENSFPEER